MRVEYHLTMLSQMLKVELKLSRIGWYLQGSVFALAVLAVGRADMPGYLRIALVGVLFAFLIMKLKETRTGKIFRFRDDGKLDVWGGMDWEEATLCPRTMVSPALTVLCYKRADARRCETCVCFFDSLDESTYRAVRIWLKWKGKLGSGQKYPSEMAIFGKVELSNHAR
jgi:hypothetical protein